MSFYLEQKIGNKENCSRKVELNKSSGTNHRAHLRLHFQPRLEIIKPNIQYFINFISDLNCSQTRTLWIDRGMVLEGLKGPRYTLIFK